MGEARRISEIVQRMYPGARQRRGGIREIRESWLLVVGERLSYHTTPSGVRRGTLLVSAEDSVWANELVAASASVLKKVNELPVGLKIVKIRVSSHADMGGKTSGG